MSMNQFERLQAWIAFQGKARVKAYRLLARMTESNVKFKRALELLRDQYNKGGKKPRAPLALMMEEWISRLDEGASTGKMLHGWVPLAEEMVIDAGSRSNRINQALNDAAEISAASNAILWTVLKGLLYPVFLAAAVLGSLIMFDVKIAPIFASILPVEKWVGLPAQMYHVSHFVSSWLAPILIIVAGLLSAAFLSLPRFTGPIRPWLEYVPPWSIYKTIKGASFLITLRGFISAGTRITHAVALIDKAADPYLKERTTSLILHQNRGKNIGEAMLADNFNFPDEGIAREISVYVGFNNFDDALDLLAKEWIEETISRVNSGMAFIRTLLMISVAIVLGSMMLSMYQIQDQIQASVR